MTYSPPRDENPAASPTRPDGLPLSRWEGVAFMATGAGLVVHIMFDVWLWLSVLTALGLAGVAVVIAARRRSVSTTGVTASQVLVAGGLAAGAALVAYDVSRWAVAWAFDYEVLPWDALPHFGSGLLSQTASETARWVAGALFHVANAVGFAMAYAVWAGNQPTRRRGVVAGVVFGLGLEAAMLGFYPAWLQIPNLREFISLSVIGHICYGATLGFVAQHRFAQLLPLSEGVSRS